MEKLRQEILEQMTETLTSEQLTRLADVLDMLMHEYDIVAKSREIMTLDKSNEIMLKNFLGNKILEGCSKRTIEYYRGVITKMFEDIGKPVTEITTNDIRYHFANWKTNRGCNNTTLNNMRRTYGAFFKWLNIEGVISQNPMDRIKAFKNESIPIKPFTSLEIEKIYDGCTNVRDRALCEFLYSTGARVSECINIRLKDLDLESKTVVICHGKGDKERTVYLSDGATYWLKKYLAERHSDDDRLWIGRRGALSVAGVEHIIKIIGKSVGVEAHPHKFRHTLATDLIKRGASIETVKEILGHVDIATTMIYIEISKNEIQNTHRKLIA